MFWSLSDVPNTLMYKYIDIINAKAQYLLNIPEKDIHIKILQLSVIGIPILLLTQTEKERKMLSWKYIKTRKNPM